MRGDPASTKPALAERLLIALSAIATGLSIAWLIFLAMAAFSTE